MNSQQTADAVFDRIKQEANARTLNCLTNLKSACDMLQQEGLEITVAKVGGFTAKMKGGPQVQSIRNNKDFESYVRARRSNQNIPEARPQMAPTGFRTGDNRIDAYIRTLELEVAAGKQHIANLKRAFTKDRTYDYHAAMNGELVLAAGAKQETFTEVEKGKLRCLFDRNYLENVGLELSQGGQLRQVATLKTVLEPDAIRAIQRICDLPQSGQDGRELSAPK